MRKVLITGAGGFIGSHLVEGAAKLGLDVRAFVRYTARGDWGWLEEVGCKDDIEVVSGDIRDYESVLGALRGVDAVFHLAALIGIPYSYVAPLAYIKTDVEGTYNVLQAARDLEVESILITSTSEVYGTAQYVPMDELHPLRPQSPYAATKAAADQLAMSFFLSFGLPVKLVRPFNTYGPRQSAHAVIPTIMTQILSGRRSLRLGNLRPTRDLTFVEDTASAFLAIAQTSELKGRVTQIGMGKEIAVGELAGLIANLLEVDIEIRVQEARTRPTGSDVERLLCDNEVLLKDTDWHPRFSLERGLLETRDGLARHLDVYKPHHYQV